MSSRLISAPPVLWETNGLWKEKNDAFVYTKMPVSFSFQGKREFLAYTLTKTSLQRQVPRYANMSRKCLLHRQIIPTGPKILFSPFSHFQVMGRWKSPVAMVKPFNVKANMTLDWREIWNPHGITSFYGLWSIFLYFPTFMTVSSIFWELRNMINVLEEPSNSDKLYYKLP